MEIWKDVPDYDNYEISYDVNGVKERKTGKFDQELIDVNLRINVRRTDIFSEKKGIIGNHRQSQIV